MNCRNCGVPLRDDATYCVRCGTFVNEVGYTDNKKQDKNAIIIAACVVGVVAVLCAAVFVLVAFGGKGEKFEFDVQYANSNYQTLEYGDRVRVLKNGYPNPNYIEMLENPSADANVKIRIEQYEFIDILENYDSKNNEFIYAKFIKDNVEYEGWVPAPYLFYEFETDGYKTLQKGMLCSVVDNIVDYDGLALRNAPSKSSESLVTVPEGASVEILRDYNDQNGLFVYAEFVKNGDTYKGWILGQYLKQYSWSVTYPTTTQKVTTTVEKTTTEKLGSDDYKNFNKGYVCCIYDTVAGAGLNLRKKATSNSTELQHGIPEGTQVLVLKDYSSADNGYIKVFCRGEIGYLMGKYLVYEYAVYDLYDYPDYAYYMENQNSTTTTEPTTTEPTTTQTTELTTTESTTTASITIPNEEQFEYFVAGETVYVGENTVYHDGLTLRSEGTKSSPKVREQAVEERQELYVLKDYDPNENGYILVEFYEDGERYEGYLKGEYLVYSLD